MTHERNLESALSTVFSDSRSTLNASQYAHYETSTMSAHGLRESSLPPEDRLRRMRIGRGGRNDESWSDVSFVARPMPTNISRVEANNEFPDPRPPKRMKIQFREFAERARLQQFHETRLRRLHTQRRLLQKSIALSSRLQRSGLWIRDGLVEVSKHSDAAVFARVFTHTQNLVDDCYAHWNHELRTLDNIQTSDANSSGHPDTRSFLTQLAANEKTDLLDLVSTLRSNPHFLIERFRNLTASQVASLSTYPKWEEFSQSVLSTFSNDSGRQSQRRKRAQFSKSLEDYAVSLERSNPLSFLLYNLYGTNQSATSHESQLRLSTWSTICAELLSSGDEASRTLTGRVLDAFAMMYGWPAKDRVELFLMDHLQKGAFLLEDFPRRNTALGYDPLNTATANTFFDGAVRELLAILSQHDGGYPTGALQLATAILGKLPTVEQQSQFRGHFFSSWFLQYFLRITITAPENENMLLKVHISKQAREHLLGHLIDRTISTVLDLYHEEAVPNPEVSFIVNAMINNLVENTEVRDPYQLHPENASQNRKDDNFDAPTLTLCAAEVVQVLEALSPQTIAKDVQNWQAHWIFDPLVLKDTRSAFQQQYSSASHRFDRLKAELLRTVVEPGTSTNDVHPCQEQWLQLTIRNDGKLKEVTNPLDNLSSELLLHLDGLDMSQLAALRLCSDVQDSGEVSFTSYLEGGTSSVSKLEDYFEQKISLSQAHTDIVESIYWQQALQQMQKIHPLTMLTNDDSTVLHEPMKRLQKSQQQLVMECTRLEGHVSILEKSFKSVKTTIDNFNSCLEQLRLKLWYSLEVTHWPGYADARNVASALNHMNLPTTKTSSSDANTSPTTGRPPSSRSTVSSLFGQPRTDAMSLLKAPAEHGGPKKLADGQIENTKKWLQRSNIDNFCKGEERLHRFCMEVKSLAQKLTRESITESPELWFSELFARESALYDVQALWVNSAPPSTRPESVMSDTPPSSVYTLSRPMFRTTESDTRSIVSDDQRFPLRRTSDYSHVSNRFGPGILVPELSSSLGSHKASSIMTPSASSIFSTPRSTTSASVHSRPPSIFNDITFSRSGGGPKQKRKFLEKVQLGLVCLLLSDLGCLVWSWGSETDAWLTNLQSSAAVTSRLRKRLDSKELISGSSRQHGGRSPITRRNSTPAPLTPSNTIQDEDVEDDEPDHSLDIDYLSGLEDVLLRLSQHIDPLDKLQAINDFSKLAVLQMQALQLQDSNSELFRSTPQDSGARRLSLDSQVKLPLLQQRQQSHLSEGLSHRSRPTETEFVRHLTEQLIVLKPKTLFRDLQYIASFAPAEMLDKTSNGKAFLQLGLAALDYKGEICRCMVDVADQIVSADSIKRQTASNLQEQSVSKAAEYLRIAALEGNAVAQRELAMLYLMHPEVLPVVSAPLFSSSEIFRDEMMWKSEVEGNSNRQALCLALHWMQQASENGDELARQKLVERGARLSFE